MQKFRDNSISLLTNAIGSGPTSIPNSLHSLQMFLIASLESFLLFALTTSTVKIGNPFVTQ